MQNAFAFLMQIKLASLAIFLGLVLSTPALAVPTLQLYSPGAVYDTGTESWMTYSNPFDLQVLGADQPNSLLLIDQVKLHIAVPAEFFTSGGAVTVQGISSSLEGGPFGPVTIPASAFQAGIPPELAGWSGNARSHGIYKDAYYVSLQLQDLEVNKSPSDTIINYVDVAEGAVSPGTDTGDIDVYQIAYSGFFLIHMDLTGMTRYSKSSKDAMEFAPFSHDADAPGAPIPEPATLLLLGGGLVGLGLAARRRGNARE